MAHFFNATRSPRSALYASRRLIRHGWQRLRYGRGRHLVNGNALMARLLRSALDADVRFQLNAPVSRLLENENGVTGAILAGDEGDIQVNARAVVLACGGFPHDKQRLAENVAHARQGYGHFSAAPPGNQGDGIRLGETVGGQFDTSLKNAMAWAPVSRVLSASGLQLAFPHLVERAKPGFLAVRPNGKRFVNEADSYHDFIAALIDATPEGEQPQAWLIADSRALHRYGLGHARPTPFPVEAWLRTGYLQSAPTLEALAEKCGIDRAELSATVARFNGFAHQGRDDDFQRGASAYNCAQGDARHQPNPTLGALEHAPYYAVRILPGSLGSFSGLKTDEQARVLNAEQRPIPGLFAVGNDMSSVMQGYYPSGGITLGPAMTFGYLVGKNLSASLNN